MLLVRTEAPQLLGLGMPKMCHIWGPSSYQWARTLKNAGLITGQPCLDSKYDPTRKIDLGLAGLADISPGTLPCPSGGGMCPPFPTQVEGWRNDVRKQAGTLPIDFLMAWIQIESFGSGCSDTQYSEVGIFQLMAGDNIAQGGTSIDQQHPVPPCIPGQSTHVWRDGFTDDQAHEQVRGGIQYVNYCRKNAEAALSAAGYLNQPGWSDSNWSYWAMVKMWHVAPATIPKLLAAGLSGVGGIPADWDDMMQYAGGIAPVNWTDNARAVGIFGDGGGSVLNLIYSSSMPIVVGVVLAIGAVLFYKKNKKLVLDHVPHIPGIHGHRTRRRRR